MTRDQDGAQRIAGVEAAQIRALADALAGVDSEAVITLALTDAGDCGPGRPSRRRADHHAADDRDRRDLDPVGEDR